MTTTDLVLVAEVPLAPREQRIRELLARVGFCTSRDMVDHCVSEGIFSNHEMERAWVEKFQGVIRKALGAADSAGLPYAGPCDDQDDSGAIVSGPPIWKQRTLWSFEDYAKNVRDYLIDRDTGHLMALRLAAECQRRFRKLIVIPDLPALSD